MKEWIYARSDRFRRLRLLVSDWIRATVFFLVFAFSGSEEERRHDASREEQDEAEQRKKERTSFFLFLSLFASVFKVLLSGGLFKKYPIFKPPLGTTGRQPGVKSIYTGSIDVARLAGGTPTRYVPARCHGVAWRGMVYGKVCGPNAIKRGELEKEAKNEPWKI